MKKVRNLIKRLFISSQDKTIKSVVTVGDIIEVAYGGFVHLREIVKVEEFEVVLNSDHERPIEWVIKVKFTSLDGKSSTECTSDKFKYIRHV